MRKRILEGHACAVPPYLYLDPEKVPQTYGQRCALLDPQPTAAARQDFMTDLLVLLEIALNGGLAQPGAEAR